MSAISSLLRFLFIHVLLLLSHGSYICKAISLNDFPSNKLGVLRRPIPLPPSPRLNPPLSHILPPPRAPPLIHHGHRHLLHDDDVQNHIQDDDVQNHIHHSDATDL
ncbi:hypothetical protein OIU74_024264 [Salix koriyanagi]|uniref:Uncharacterized protein n=1 Tax=Salix koriyanagi TaxID=2511006 RepID=A0A9Q0W718_9ROSI|nr:hypothetical protein OIU74_024264 [Salix koriyanagi]